MMFLQQINNIDDIAINNVLTKYGWFFSSIIINSQTEVYVQYGYQS